MLFKYFCRLCFSCFFLTLLLLWSSCGHSSDSYFYVETASTTIESDAEETEHVHTPVPVKEISPTCEEDGRTGGIQCQTCRFFIILPSSVNKLGHTCDTGICDRCGKIIQNGKIAPESGIWSGGVYKDEFGDLTDDRVVFSDPIAGTFSNTATNDSKLGVIVYSEKSTVKIRLFEYDKYPVTYSFYSYEVHIKHGDTKETLYANLEDGYIEFYNRDSSKLQEILLSGEDIQFVIYEYGGTSTYKFALSASNFLVKYLKTFYSTILKDLPDGAILLQEQIAVGSFKEALEDYPSIDTISASAMLDVYDDILMHLIDFYISEAEPSPADKEEIQMKSAERYGLSLEQVKTIYEFVGSNYEIVKSAAEYNGQ